MRRPRKINPAKRAITLTEAELNRAIKATANKATEEAIKLTQAIFFTVLCDKENADKEVMKRVWREIEDLSDSVAKNYVSAHDLVKTLWEDYGIKL